MSTLKKISPRDAAKKTEEGLVTFIDVREADEFAREHIPGSRSWPLSRIGNGASAVPAEGQVVFLCRSGNRTDLNAASLTAVAGDALILEGGLDAWRAEGFATKVDKKAPLEIMRQVQITAGSLVFLGVVLGTWVHPGFYGVSAFVGAGLTFAGVSGWCGMAKILALLPWNRQPAV